MSSLFVCITPIRHSGALQRAQRCKEEKKWVNASEIQNGGEIPIPYSCEGRNVSPPLSRGDVPVNVKSFIVHCQDLARRCSIAGRSFS